MRTKKLYSRQYAGKNCMLNPDWVYVPAAQTDVAATFRREHIRQINEAIDAVHAAHKADPHTVLRLLKS